MPENRNGLVSRIVCRDFGVGMASLYTGCLGVGNREAVIREWGTGRQYIREWGTGRQYIREWGTGRQYIKGVGNRQAGWLINAWN